MTVQRAALRYGARNAAGTRYASPTVLPELLAACAALRRSSPQLVQWIEDGAPNLTETEHAQRFGEPYRAGRSRREPATATKRSARSE